MHKKRMPLKPKAAALAAIAALTLTVQAAPVSAAEANAAPKAAAAASVASDKAFNEFEAYLKKKQIAQAIRYLNAHIDEVDRYRATIMTLHLENAVVAEHPAMSKRFESQSMQTKIGAVYKFGDGLSDVYRKTGDAALRTLLVQAQAAGYKLETAEGMFFPVINYSIFRVYGKYVTADISAYINIMAEETKQASLKDAAITIGYQQLVNRALSQERFLQMYPGSNRAARVKELLEHYKLMTFYGSNNTPLFGYDDNAMHPNAKKAYEAMLRRNQGGKSSYLALLGKFMDLLSDEEYKRTAEVEAFLKTNVPID